MSVMLAMSEKQKFTTVIAIDDAQLIFLHVNQQEAFQHHHILLDRLIY